MLPPPLMSTMPPPSLLLRAVPLLLIGLVVAGEYSTHVYTRKAQELFEKWDTGDKPIFLYLAWQGTSPRTYY